MLFNVNHNNVKNDSLIKMSIRNLFRTSGYWGIYIPKWESGIDLVLNEIFSNKFQQWFPLKICLPDFNFSTSDVFSKFGITIPNNITILAKIDDMDAARTAIETKIGKSFPLPEEGDVIMIPFQNSFFKNLDPSTLNDATNLEDILKSNTNAMNYLLEIDSISTKEFIFNGQAYYYKFTASVYQKKKSSTFSGDLDVMNEKTKSNPEQESVTQDIYQAPTTSTGGVVSNSPAVPTEPIKPTPQTPPPDLSDDLNNIQGFGDLTKYD